MGYRETPDEENVRVFTASNDRPGITLRKTDWNGNPLGGAKFSLTRGDILVGEYTAASNGLITVAYLSAGVDYTLNETLTPVGHHGLNTPMTLRVGTDGTLSVSGIDPDYYVITPASGVTTQLAIKNRAYNFRFLKEDVDGHTPLAGAKFELHRGITGYNGNTMDARVMSGYGNLVSDADGVIQRLTANGAVIAELGYQLPAGTYYLKEVSAPEGYASISGTLCFTVDNKGVVQITDDAHPERGQWLVTTVDPDTGGISYCVTVPNERAQKVRILKTDLDGHPLKGAAFSLYRAEDFDETAGKPMDGAAPIFADTTASNGLLVLGELTLGNYFLVETTSPNGYRALHDPVDLVLTRTGVMAQIGSLSCQVTESEGVWQVRVINDTGIQLPATGGSGTAPIYLIGGLLLLGAAIPILLRRKKIKQ